MPNELVTLIPQSRRSTVDGLLEAASSLHFDRIRIAAAFASEPGVNLLQSSLEPDPEWKSASKMFLIGIEQGLTQPEALERLSDLPRTEVRIPQASEVLMQRYLTTASSFHPKAYCLDQQRESLPFALIIGSANLTRGGLSRNTELSMRYLALEASSASWQNIRVTFNSWWNSQWRRGEPLTRRLLRQVRQAREHIRREAPHLFLAEEVSSGELVHAHSFWIEGSLHGGSRNQLELPQGVESFFAGAAEYRDQDRFDFILHHHSGSWSSWLQFWHSNQVWRLRLPTANEGVTGYDEDSAFCFERISQGDFMLTFASRGSGTAAEWERMSLSFGTLRRTMKGVQGRNYGWF